MKKFSLAFLIIILFCSIHIFAKEKPINPDSIRYRFAPVVVTGQRYEMSQKDVAASISIISPAEIKQANFTNVADAISYLTPGVFTTRRSNLGYGVAALAGGSVTIRGMGGKPNSRVLMLIDGRPDFQGIFSHPINDAYFMDSVDHIEVLRGPASAVYGTNALGGVVNIITKGLPASGFETNLNLEYGSYNTQKYRLQHSGNISQFQYYAAVGYYKSDGHRKNGDIEGQNYTIKLGYQISPHYKISFNSSITPYKFHDPGPVQGKNYLSGYFEFGDITRNSMDLTFSNKFQNADGTIKIHGNFGKHKLSDGWDSDDQTNGIVAFQNFNLPYQIKTTLGFDIKRYGGTARSSGKKLGTFFNDEYAAYLHLQKIFLKKVILATGIRFENNSNFRQEWIPKFGLVYHPFSQIALRTNVAKGFRTPSIRDLFLFPPANKDLKPEQLWNYELGINQSFGKYFSVDVAGFYYEGDQLIETIVIEPGQMQNQNIGFNKVKGFEVALQARPIEKLTATISYSYLNPDEIIPFAPNKLNFLVNYKIAPINLSLYGEYISDLYASYQLNQFPPKITMEKLSDYAVVHFKFRYDIFDQLQLSIGVENIFDESFQILNGYPMPGRTILSNLSFSF